MHVAQAVIAAVAKMLFHVRAFGPEVPIVPKTTQRVDDTDAATSFSYAAAVTTKPSRPVPPRSTTWPPG